MAAVPRQRRRARACQHRRGGKGVRFGASAPRSRRLSGRQMVGHHPGAVLHCGGTRPLTGDRPAGRRPWLVAVATKWGYDQGVVKIAIEVLSQVFRVWVVRMSRSRLAAIRVVGCKLADHLGIDGVVPVG
jgi:hypothetical protein